MRQSILDTLVQAQIAEEVREMSLEADVDFDDERVLFDIAKDEAEVYAQRILRILRGKPFGSMTVVEMRTLADTLEKLYEKLQTPK